MTLKITALERFPKTGGALYIFLGWCGPVEHARTRPPARPPRPDPRGGIVYTIGAALFSASRPRLSPTWFGYHEVWHALGVTAGALMFAANLSLVSSAGA